MKSATVQNHDPSEQSKESGTEFRPNDLIWARMRGFPPWPAKVMELSEEVPRGRLPVTFFGTHETSYVKLPDCMPYIPHRQEFEVPRKHKGFNEAVHEIRVAAGVSQPGDVDAAFPVDQRDEPSALPPNRQRTTSTRSYDAAQAYFEKFKKRSVSESRSRADSAASALKQMMHQQRGRMRAAAEEQQQSLLAKRKQRLNSESSAGSLRSRLSQAAAAGINFADFIEGNDSEKLIRDTFIGNHDGHSRRTRNSSSRMFEDFFPNFAGSTGAGNNSTASASGSRTRKRSGSASSLGRNRLISCSGFSGVSDNLNEILMNGSEFPLNIESLTKIFDDFSSEGSMERPGTPELPQPFVSAPHFCNHCGSEMRHYQGKWTCFAKFCSGSSRKQSASSSALPYSSELPSTSYGAHHSQSAFYSHDFGQSLDNQQGQGNDLLSNLTNIKNESGFYSPERADNYSNTSERVKRGQGHATEGGSALHTLAAVCQPNQARDDGKTGRRTRTKKTETKRLSPTPPLKQPYQSVQNYNADQTQGVVPPHLIGKRSHGRPKTYKVEKTPPISIITGQRHCTHCNGLVRPQMCGANRHRWRCVDKKCRKWYGWVKPTDEIPEDIVRRGRGGKKPTPIIRTKREPSYESSPEKSQKRRVGRPPKSEVHGIKLMRKPIRETKYTTGPRLALVGGRVHGSGGSGKRKLDDEEEDENEQLYGKREELDDLGRRPRRTYGEQILISYVQTGNQRNETQEISLTQREASYKPCAMERRSRWWISEKRRVDCSPEREISSTFTDSAAAFKLMSQSFRTAAVTRADEAGTVNGAMDLLLDSLVGSMGPLLGLLQKLPVFARNEAQTCEGSNSAEEEQKLIAERAWAASTLHIPIFH